MDRYQKVEKPRAETAIDENEIRITSQGRMRSYITYAITLLQDKGSNEIVFKAMGRAINKTVTIVELIKQRIVGLHQITLIGSTDITDTWEPLEEGLLPLETTRHVSMITITLSKNELNTSALGYQPPLPAEQVKASAEFDYEGGEGSPNGRAGRGRGGRGRKRGRVILSPANGFNSSEYEDGGWDRNQSRGRGRGRGFRGRGRGYNGRYGDVQQDGGYNNEAPNRGRGRGGYNIGCYVDVQQDGGYNNNRGRDRGGYNGRYGDGSYNNEAPNKGRGRGGYNRCHVDVHQDGGYNNEAPNRGRGRGGYSERYVDVHRDGGYDNDAPYRGRRRGGYNGPHADVQQDGGYNNKAPNGGHGPGRGRGNRGRGRGFRSIGPTLEAG